LATYLVIMYQAPGKPGLVQMLNAQQKIARRRDWENRVCTTVATCPTYQVLTVDGDGITEQGDTLGLHDTFCERWSLRQ
jgi:hypothetical protein